MASAFAADALEVLRRFQVDRLKHGEPALDRKALDGAGSWLQAAARRSVRLRQNQRNFVTRAEQASQRPFSELGRAGED